MNPAETDELKAIVYRTCPARMHPDQAPACLRSLVGQVKHCSVHDLLSERSQNLLGYTRTRLDELRAEEMDPSSYQPEEDEPDVPLGI